MTTSPVSGCGTGSRRPRGCSAPVSPPLICFVLPPFITVTAPPLSPLSRSAGYGKQVVGHATEYSLSTVIGGVKLWEPQTTWPEYCWSFLHQCAFPGSPCKGPNQRPEDLCPGEQGDGRYPDDDELEPQVEIAWCPEMEGVPPDDPRCPSFEAFAEDMREEDERTEAAALRQSRLRGLAQSVEAEESSEGTDPGS